MKRQLATAFLPRCVFLVISIHRRRIFTASQNKPQRESVKFFLHTFAWAWQMSPPMGKVWSELQHTSPRNFSERSLKSSAAQLVSCVPMVIIKVLTQPLCYLFCFLFVLFVFVCRIISCVWVGVCMCVKRDLICTKCQSIKGTALLYSAK